MRPDPFSDVPYHALARFGTTIRRMRISRGLTGAALGQLVHLSQPQVSRIEVGRSLPSIDDVTRIADALDLSELERRDLFAQHSVLKLPEGNRRKLKLIGYVPIMQRVCELERIVAFTRTFCLNLVPGLIQTEPYARGISDRVLHASPEVRDAVVRVRMERQRNLWRRDGQFDFLLFETVLYAIYCAIEDHVAQLDRIRILAHRRNISVGIIPARITPPPELSSSFHMLGNVGVIVDDTIDSRWIDDPSDVERYQLHFDELSDLALRGDELDKELQAAIDWIEAKHVGQ